MNDVDEDGVGNCFSAKPRLTEALFNKCLSVVMTCGRMPNLESHELLEFMYEYGDGVCGAATISLPEYNEVSGR